MGLRMQIKNLLPLTTPLIFTLTLNGSEDGSTPGEKKQLTLVEESNDEDTDRGCCTGIELFGPCLPASAKLPNIWTDCMDTCRKRLKISNTEGKKKIPALFRN
ncbi:hypothetical protein AB205_0133140 [Aquarana catesbeiana]|uniref:Kazal-like domain-containing protein n=1 Tax=Aquarana catesbeiana TaxID=8400 RepID=A0A2G9RQN0_AQUCT|nr:hypothetical protein AB205_0133140 [Aquarana catesbeiana]